MAGLSLTITNIANLAAIATIGVGIMYKFVDLDIEVKSVKNSVENLKNNIENLFS